MVHPSFKEHSQVSLRVQLVTRQVVLLCCCSQHSSVTQILAVLKALYPEGHSWHRLTRSKGRRAFQSSNPRALQRGQLHPQQLPAETGSRSTWTPGQGLTPGAPGPRQSSGVAQGAGSCPVTLTQRSPARVPGCREPPLLHLTSSAPGRAHRILSC